MSTIKVGDRRYSIPPPEKPIPSGVVDCFGHYRDMEMQVCKECSVNQLCGSVMDILISIDRDPDGRKSSRKNEVLRKAMETDHVTTKPL